MTSETSNASKPPAPPSLLKKRNCVVCGKVSRLYKPFCVGCESVICDSCTEPARIDEYEDDPEQHRTLLTCCNNQICDQCVFEDYNCRVCEKEGCPVCLDLWCRVCTNKTGRTIRLCDSCADQCEQCSQWACAEHFSPTTIRCVSCIHYEAEQERCEKRRAAKRKFLAENPDLDLSDSD